MKISLILIAVGIAILTGCEVITPDGSAKLDGPSTVEALKAITSYK